MHVHTLKHLNKLTTLRQDVNSRMLTVALLSPQLYKQLLRRLLAHLLL